MPDVLSKKIFTASEEGESVIRLVLLLLGEGIECLAKKGKKKKLGEEDPGRILQFVIAFISHVVTYSHTSEGRKAREI